MGVIGHESEHQCVSKSAIAPGPFETAETQRCADPVLHAINLHSTGIAPCQPTQQQQIWSVHQTAMLNVKHAAMTKFS